MNPLTSLGSHGGSIVRLLVIGELLVSVCDGGELCAWDLAHASLVGRKHRQGVGFSSEGGAKVLSISLGKAFGEPSALMHPDTYLNKV
jgi:hypothetical protein